MELNFNSPFVKQNIKAISDYFEAKARGEQANLEIDGQIILSCDGTQGIDWNNEEASFDSFDYEGVVIAFDELEAGLMANDAMTVTSTDTTTVDGINTTRTIVTKHPLGKAPKNASAFDTRTCVTLTKSGMSKMHTWLMMVDSDYRKSGDDERQGIISKRLFDPRFRTDGSLAFVKNYQKVEGLETLTCLLEKDKDIQNVYAMTEMTIRDVDYGTAYPTMSGGHTSHRTKSDFAYRGYGA